MIIETNGITPQSFAGTGLSFESHFRNGGHCIVAQPSAPQLFFSQSMPLEFVRETIDAWNAELKGRFPGTGYYAFSQEEEMVNPEHHVLVLFSDAVFCEALLGSVINGTLPVNLIGSAVMHFGGGC